MMVQNNGRKRSLLVDTEGNLLKVVVHPAEDEDRDGAEAILGAKARSFRGWNSSRPTRRMRARSS